MKNKNVMYLTQAAMIAALYVVLTEIANALGLASGSIQVRFSEALTVLPFFTPAAIPGLFIGCLISNFITGAPLPDVVFGSLATLIGAFGTLAVGSLARRSTASSRQTLLKWLAPLPPILANGIIIPFVLKYAYGVIPLWFSFVTVTLGEIVSCGVLGMLLFFSLQKYQKQLFPGTGNH